jgi:hypothetical protein
MGAVKLGGSERVVADVEIKGGLTAVHRQLLALTHQLSSRTIWTRRRAARTRT